MSLTKASYAMIDSAPVSVLDFGAVGNGVVDDTAAIQAALDYAGANGGGTVVLPRTSATGRYRTTSVLRIPSYVTLEGTNPLVFPFSYNNGILADFTNVNQWVIEAKTTSGGNNIAYNTVLTAFPDGATYNCGIRNLRIAGGTNVPYGGVRMQGSFGPTIENVAIANVGCGFLLNESLTAWFFGTIATQTKLVCTQLNQLKQPAFLLDTSCHL
jgi:polygalacturonase